MNTNIILKRKERDSNIELLRIIAMILVMMVHANFFLLGAPSLGDVNNSFPSSFLRFFSESLCIICVNVYILISGWFGINAKVIRLLELVFQVIFIAVFIYLVFRIFGLAEPASMKRWIHLLLFKDIWFIRSFIVFYVLTPVLNAFVKTATREQFKIVLIGFYLVQTLFGGLISNSDFFSGGYSPLSFMGLYLLGRYIHLYPNRLTSMNKYYDMLIYLITSLITTLVSILLVVIGYEDAIWRFYNYSSPIVIISCLYFFLFFTKISFKSKIINWISISSFAAFLVHGDYLFWGIYSGYIKSWFNSKTTLEFILFTASLIIVVFLLAILIDKIRIIVWRYTCSLFMITKRLHE